MVYFITIVGFILAFLGLVWVIRDELDRTSFSRWTKAEARRKRRLEKKYADDPDDDDKKPVYRADTHVNWDWFDVQDEKKSTPSPQPQQAPSKSSDVKKPTEAPPAARQTPPTGIPSAAKRTPPMQKPAPQPAIGVIKVPEVRVDPAFFTPELAAKYKERGSSLRLGRALTQGMLLEHLKTDKTVTPHEASATVHSLHSGLSYQTTLTKCSCPDHQKRGEPCKHMLALAVYVKAITLDESSQP